MIHKCQGLTLSEIVVDMTSSKGKYRSGQAYVTFCHVCEVSKLHIINYTCSQIHLCEYSVNQAYVTFSHVCEVSELHIINYTCSQIHVCEYSVNQFTCHQHIICVILQKP